MIRIAAVGDTHLGMESVGRFRPHLEHLAQRADVLLLAGDLTHVGGRDEAEVVREALREYRERLEPQMPLPLTSADLSQ